MAKKKYRKYRYSKSQIARNRFIFIMICITIVGLSIWGVGKIIESTTESQDTASQSTDGASSDSESSASGSEIEPANSDGDESTSESQDESASDDSTSESEGEEASSSESEESEGLVDMTYPGDDPPMLVNKENYIPEGYEPALSSVGDGYEFATVGVQALKDMMSAAANEGVNLWIVSAYRSNERQTNNYNARIDAYIAEGKTREEAIELTEQFIAPPGTSEHTLGLAVDFNSLYQSFEDTPEFEWLVENCATFGFILRYDKDKVAVTGFSYEPWHYRFVGTNHSHAIMESGLSLEEYLSANY